MNHEIYQNNGKVYERVTKQKARDAFNNGDIIYVAMNHTRMNYLNAWNVNGCEFHDTGYGVTFDDWCEKCLYTMKYYKLGTYLKYFIEVKL